MTSVGVDSVTARLAENWATAPAAAFPLAALERARLCLRDTIGVILGALALPEGRQIEQFVVEDLGGPAQASIVGSAAHVGRRHAAFANGWLADLLDYEDGYLYGGTHPSAAIIPAVLALAEEKRLDGSAVLRAIVAGYDVADRIARAIHPEHQNRGFAAAGTVGALGAAAAAGVVLGLDSRALSQALGIAAFLAPLSPSANLWAGHSIKPAHLGQAAAVGLDAALLARRGFDAAPLEGTTTHPQGFFSLASAEPRLKRALDGLGHEITILDCSFKPYPTCGYNHGAVDAALQLLWRHRLRPVEIESIEVRTYHLVDRYVGHNYTVPTSGLAACQFSLPYNVAVALHDGTLTARQFQPDRRADLEVLATARRVHVTEDPNLSAQYPRLFPIEVEIVARSESYSVRLDHRRGSPQHPLSEAELRQKFDGLAVPLLGAERAAAGAKALDAFEQVADVEAFLAGLATVAGAAGSQDGN